MSYCNQIILTGEKKLKKPLFISTNEKTIKSLVNMHTLEYETKFQTCFHDRNTHIPSNDLGTCVYCQQHVSDFFLWCL